MAAENQKSKTEFFKKFLRKEENKILKISMENALQELAIGSGCMFLRCLKAVAVDAKTDVTFSTATCKVEAIGFETNDRKYMAPIGCFFLTGFKILQDLLADKNRKVPADGFQHRAVQRLLQFLSSDHSVLVKRTEQECEAVLARRYAEHLLMPLVDEKKYVIDTYPGIQYLKCCDVEHTYSGECGDTSFGLLNGWHGKVDILIKSKNEEELPVLLGESSGDDASSMSSLDNAYTQMIAETFVFSFLRRKQYSGKMHNFLIPSIGMSNDKLVVFMYDCEKDVLLGTHELDLFDEENLDVRIIIFLWLVLNYRLFCTGLIDEFKSYKAEFHTLLGDDCLQRYRNAVTMPCHKIQSQKRRLDLSKPKVAPLLQKRMKIGNSVEILQVEMSDDDSD